MRSPVKEKLLWSIGVLALVAVLAVLAALQYRWSDELNDAASDRMRAGLQSSMMGMREELSRELAGISASVQLEAAVEGVPEEAESYTQKLETWKRTATHPELISNIYLWQHPEGDAAKLLVLNVATRQFEATAMPADFENLRTPVRDLSEFLERLPRNVTPPTHLHFLPRFMPTPWFISESIPALMHAQVEPNSQGSERRKISWLIVQLNPAVFQQQIFPELAQRYFGDSSGLVYDVAVLNRTRENRVVYTSNPKFGTGQHIPTDGRLSLFGPPIGGTAGTKNVIMPHAVNTADMNQRNGLREWRGTRYGGAFRLEPVGHEGDWELIVRHRKGSLEAAIAALRYRHLAISFGVLWVLAATMAMIIVAARRAQRLAQLQMNFVAGVSHELRTPLAVISSAAENIADGIVEDKKKVARYGTVIRNQSRQLSQLVEQLLLFAATRQDRYQYTSTRIAPSELVQTALNNSAELIRSTGFTVEQSIEERLPAVEVDVPAVCHCLQNLIANAIKYGGESRWLGVQARHQADRREVEITIEDRGIGIDPADRKRIFDPFYRSPSVVAAQIHGTGIGLALAKGIAEAMGGTITVESTPGQGSAFTLHLPCADELISEKEEAVAATAGADEGKNS